MRACDDDTTTSNRRVRFAFIFFVQICLRVTCNKLTNIAAEVLRNGWVCWLLLLRDESQIQFNSWKKCVYTQLYIILCWQRQESVFNFHDKFAAVFYGFIAFIVATT